MLGGGQRGNETPQDGTQQPTQQPAQPAQQQPVQQQDNTTAEGDEIPF